MKLNTIVGWANLMHLGASSLLVYALATGILQDADQWREYRFQVYTQVAMFTVSPLAVRMAIYTLYRQRLILLASPTALLISLVLGWAYWLDMGSNNALAVVAVLSVTIATVYFASAWHFFRFPESRR